MENNFEVKLQQFPIYCGPVIDAHFHYFNVEGFVEVAKAAGYENTAHCWRQICQDNNIIFGIAMGNTYDATVRYGGIAPRLINLAGPFDETKFNQDPRVGYCLGVISEEITLEKAEKTALEFEYYLQNDSHCLGIKLYPGYNAVYPNDKRHWPLFELAKAYKVPVVIHSGDTSWSKSHLKYSHPLHIDDCAADFPETRFVIAHCGCPWFRDACEVGGKNPNVAIDLSGMVAGNPPEAVLYHDCGGVWQDLRTWLNYMGDFSRLMYGSDWPLPNIPMYIKLMSSIIPEKHHEAFFYKNALRIFKRIKPLLIE